MATAQFAQRGATPMFKSDLDMDSLFDFNQSTFSERASSRTSARAGSSKAAAQVYEEDGQVFAGPSHEYDRFPQQTGVGVDLSALNQPMPDGFGMGGFNSGIEEGSFGMGWNSGVDMDADMNMDFTNQGMFKNNFVDPSYIEAEQPQSDVGRLWPGMHQQAALAKAQQQQQQPQQNKGKGRATQVNDPHTEESISRLLNQMRQSSTLSSIQEDDAASQSNMSRMRKAEEEMDEDERLLASEEGKKLSSKERRQLRNKVSARAFRSRRKEYIGQLEGEVAMKVQEANELRNQNRALMEENARSRAFIERLLRHKAFGPFLEDLVAEEGLAAQAPLASMPSSSTPVVSAPAPAPAPFQFSQPENTQVGMTMVPEAQFDFSQLNINNNASNANWGMGNGFTGYQPRVFAVTELPEGPTNPLDVSAMSGKGHNTIFAAEDEASTEELKADYPVIERPIEFKQPAMTAVEEEDAEDEEYDLYRSTPIASATPAAPLENIFTNPEKASRFTLVVSEESTEAELTEHLEKRIAAMEPAFQRIAAITSMLDC